MRIVLNVPNRPGDGQPSDTARLDEKRTIGFRAPPGTSFSVLESSERGGEYSPVRTVDSDGNDVDLVVLAGSKATYNSTAAWTKLRRLNGQGQADAAIVADALPGDTIAPAAVPARPIAAHTTSANVMPPLYTSARDALDAQRRARGE